MPLKANMTAANFKLRLLASILDFFIFFTIHAYFWQYLSSSPSLAELINRLLIYLIILVLSPLGFIYNIFFTYYFGGTPGKLLTGLKIVNENGEKLTLKKLLFRQTAGYQFASTLFGFGYYSVAKNPQHQGWHDQAVGSKVIITKSLWPLSILISLTLLIFSITTIISTVNQFKSSNLAYEISSLVRLYQIENKNKVEESTPSASPNFLED